MSDKKEWFENEDFWDNYAPVMFDENRWAEAKGIADSIFNLASLKNNSYVMDACSGPGRISVELALLGTKVCAIDLMENYLALGKETAEDENVSDKIEFLKEDMRYFYKENTFDAAINVYNSFGYCDTIEDDKKIIKNIYKSLKEGGTFVFECISRETAALEFTEGEWYERSGLTILTEFKVSGLWEGLVSHWKIITEDGQVIDHTFTQRLYSAKELYNMFSDAGFKNIEVFGGFDLRPYDHKAKTLVIKAKK